VTVLEPRPNPETLEVLLDTTWRIAAGESARTDALDRKAATIATFASAAAALSATVGVRLVEREPERWALTLFLAGLVALLAAVSFALHALHPKEYLTLGIAYLRRFPTWGEILKTPDQVRGETMRTLVETIVRERATNQRKVASIRWSFLSLVAGLLLVTAQGATLALHEVIG
jgi:hypothetical protein